MTDDRRILGVLSDSHGRTEITGQAIALLRASGAQTFIHLGDVECSEVIDELAGLEAHLVFGNCDYDHHALARHAHNLGVQVHHPAGRMVIGECRIAFTHGHLHEEVEQALAERVDLLLVGHTHAPCDERIGDTRVVNPGALFRARRYTAARIDPVAGVVEIIDVRA